MDLLSLGHRHTTGDVSVEECELLYVDTSSFCALTMALMGDGLLGAAPIKLAVAMNSTEKLGSQLAIREPGGQRS